ncbi:hypothetical protein [Photobacterium leiognathi]|uniref:hypothetical protein n=1 Tax=Photobacterium leiognathi TaxID=553611 RepID=UPI002732A701|nr:hypothetical protein [Photobacterium leiognathi]
MEQVSNILKSVKNPFSLGSLIVIFIGTVFIKGGDPQIPSWALLLSAIFIWVVSLFVDIRGKSKNESSKNNEELVNSLKDEISKLRNDMSRLEEELKEKDARLDKFTNIKSEIVSVCANDKDYTTLEILERMEVPAEDNEKRSETRKVIGVMKQDKTLIHFWKDDRLRLAR